MAKRNLRPSNTLAFVPGLIPFTPIRHPVRILVVEDDSLVGQAMVILLRAVGHEPVLCAHPESAFRNFCMEDFDLILTDYDMPEMNGVELAQKMKKIKSTPIILVTGGSRIRLIEDLPNSGIFLVLKKPFKPAAIEVAIKTLFPHAVSSPGATTQTAEKLSVR